MQSVRSAVQEAAEDIYFGQVVTIWARWFLIGAGTILTLWTANESDQLVVGIIPVVALMALNFFLYGRYMIDRPSNHALVSIAGVVDLAAITAVVALWSDDTGLASPFFILYYPVVLAFAFVMPRKASAPFTIAALAAYAAVCMLLPLVSDAAAISQVADQKTLIMRLVTIAATGGLGTYYWRMQRDRRRAAVGGAGGPSRT